MKPALAPKLIGGAGARDAMLAAGGRSSLPGYHRV